LFFFFYLFAIIVASSKAGARFGFLVTIVSGALCILVSQFVPTSGEFDVTRFAMRPLAIVGLGIHPRRTGEARRSLEEEDDLAERAFAVANPRFGVDWTIELIPASLLGFWSASHCVIPPHPGIRTSNLYIVAAERPQSLSKALSDAKRRGLSYIDMAGFGRSDCTPIRSRFRGGVEKTFQKL
jgi:hypothetical protein